MPSFIPGLELSRLFYTEAVGPILARAFPGLRYAAALIGPGSEVLGFDTPLSTDHHWGPRLMLFLNPADEPTYAAQIQAVLGRQLPTRFYGYSTHFGPPDAIGVRLMEDRDAGPVDHRVEVFTLREYVRGYLGFDPADEIQVKDWLVCSEHKLLSLTAGAVYRDPTGELGALRRKIAYYPRDLWLYRLSAQWTRISQEEAFLGRCGDVGDELGSQIIAARLARDLMRLCFMLEKRYIPYSKWLGSGFARLVCSAALAPLFRQALQAPSWPERQAAMSSACETIADLHNQAAITAPLETRVTPFYGRPYRVIHAARFAGRIREAIRDPAVLALPDGIGSIDQFADCTDLVSNPALANRLRPLYE